MPGLVACGRRWEIGSDDLVFPGMSSVVIRLAWIVAIAVVYQVHHADLVHCDGGDVLLSYLTGVLILLAIVITLEIVIVYCSMQGTIMNPVPRRHLPILLYFRLLLYVPEIIWTIIGTRWAFKENSMCDSTVINTVKAAVISSWIILIFVMIGIGLVFDPLGKLHVKVKDSEQLESDEAEQLRQSAHMAAHRLWENRCKLLCCCAGFDENSQTAFSDAAELMTGFFKGTDIVPSDIAAGLALIQLEQQAQEQVGNASSPPVTTDYPCLRRPPISPYIDIQNVAYYMKYAVASYGWPLYVYSNPLCGTCQLFKNCRCVCCCSSSQDNCCECNTAALKDVTGLKDCDIIYCNFHNSVYEIPFFVALDHSQLAVIISIRGSLSLKDALTDMTVGCCSLDNDAMKHICAHKGILQAARYIKNKLENEHILERAFREAPDYKIIIVGHSLGAGTAALLTILLHNTWPGLHCYAYSPPGGLLSSEGCVYSKDLITSVVVGKDVIPRLSIQTMEDMRQKILRVLRNNTQPKYQILLGGCWYTACGLPERMPAPTEDVESGPHMNQPLLDERTATTGSRPRNYTTDDSQATDSSANTPLFPPGQIIHIVEDTPGSWCGEPVYSATWAGADTFSNIVISGRMVIDHMPDVVMKALQQISESTVLPLETTHITSDDSFDEEEEPVIT
ncbi:diacylglycerol lipase-beta-like [Saccoglossus kowalevskii]|uniref:sn-1-specific diacylglycerol lipase n=1 Tax=Saccoglossus kowalevskii TaxID=10224 RepID=A0ABM0M0L4_SACKO|nr:PREDICTED: sn1-specific diacylglycerol lipase beta-like [Saccoglossus kowalevskii]